MFLHVSPVVGGSQEGLPANNAHNVSLSCVRALMSAKISVAVEAFVALVTGERSQPYVCHRVSFQSTFCAERCPTLITKERPCTCVGHHVRCQSAHGNKCSLTDGAFKWHLASMFSFVNDQGSALFECFVTLVTPIWPLVGMNPHVLDKRVVARERLVALVTPEGSFSRVSPVVGDQILLVAE